MTIRQISVFVENKSGRLFDVAETLGKANINIRALSLADTLDFGVIRLIVDDVAKATDALKVAGFTASLTDVLAIRIADVPGGLAGVLSVLTKKGIDIEYMYAFAGSTGKDAVMIFRIEKAADAVKALSDTKGLLLSDEELRSL
ncbi:MAG: ACT domain-containing protein [Spirochaetota bacterium]